MTGTNNGEVKRPTEHTLGPSAETVHLTALHLLAALPERPMRLRVQTAGVSIDLDWRSAPEPATALRAAHAAETVQRLAAPPPVDPRTAVADEGRSTSHFVCAPAIGTFYHAPAPGKPPFVVPGSLVEAGQQVGIIEAMKLMLPIEAERAGQVVSFLVADGQPVEYGNRLIELGPVDPE
jgi:acetyl-CoA carboxylase biotin carboxyl carrier protein